ncbi:hypothetical protein F751_5058 [Auxenochlorella protothecoides]|uniref:Secreted protein n=1 Tax=Auxenochlorella protothecoides TaxID=3075 RepID=A0A087SER2_AUXPR|nr:hypothetical protein F751_5058 [Auxenochlorella protothecoides]KFM24216.1 hypothetical protein F751_5058 [Auxenochlorella protothecoides]
MRAQGALCFVVMLVGISGIAAARHLLTEAGSDPSPFMTLDSIMCTSTSPTEVVCEGVVTTAAMVPRVTLVLRLGRNLRFLDVLPHDNRVAFRGSVDSPTAVGSAYATAHNQQGDLVESNVLAIASLTLVESVPRMTLVYNLNGEKYFADCTSSSLEVTCTNTLRSAVATGTCQASGDTATQRFFQSRIVDIAPFPAQPPAA